MDFDKRLYEIIRYNKFNLSDTEAVAAITQLFRDVVKEAKPGFDAVSGSERDKAIVEYESNLLKTIGEER